MSENKEYESPEWRTRPNRVKLQSFGLILFWGASIAFGADLNKLLTPANYPIGADPSFDIVVAAFCFLLASLGALLALVAMLDREGRLAGNIARNINRAILVVGLGIVVAFITGIILFSGEKAFAAQYVPKQLDEPTPDTALPAFQPPAMLNPTPTYDSNSIYMVGPIKSAFDELRVGDIWISAEPAKGTVYYVQVYMDRIACSIQAGDAPSDFAVDKSQVLIQGPVQISDGFFYVGNDLAAVHGVMSTSGQSYGTVWLRYVDPATQQACDLGSFTWTAILSQRN